MASFNSPGPFLLGTINTKSGTFSINFEFDNTLGRGKLVVSGPSSAEFMDPNATPNTSSPYGITDTNFNALYRAATEFCYSWSADFINSTRNDLEVVRNDLELSRNNIITKLTDTVYDLRDDIRAVKHRAVNVDEGIYTQKACWETQCIENKASKIAQMMTTQSYDLPTPDFSVMDRYQRAKTLYSGFRTHTHTEDILDDVPQEIPRTSGTVEGV